MLFFGSRCERLCMMQFSLISLIPGLLRNLQDSAGPDLDNYEKRLAKPTSLRTSDRNSLLSYMGLPLQIFGKGSLFGPYTPLQQLDVLADFGTKSYIVGSTNSLLLQQKDRYSDILINLDEDTLNVTSTSLRAALQLSVPDRRWIDFITQNVNDTWDEANPGRPNTLGYVGSEEFIRLQFEEYLLSLLSSVKYHSHLTRHANNPRMLLPHIDGDPSVDFGPDFIEAWKRTENYRIWDAHTDSHLFDVVEPKHPCAGGLTIDDVQRRITQQVQDLHLDERFATGKEVLGRNLAAGREKASTMFNKLYADMEALREAQRKRAEEASAAGQGAEKSATPATTQTAGTKAGSFVNSWAAWAGEKRKAAGWGRATSGNTGSSDSQASGGGGGGWTSGWGKTRNRASQASGTSEGLLEKETRSERGRSLEGRPGNRASAGAESLFDAATEGKKSLPASPKRRPVSGGEVLKKPDGVTVVTAPVIAVDQAAVIKPEVKQTAAEPEANEEANGTTTAPFTKTAATEAAGEGQTVETDKAKPTLKPVAADADVETPPLTPAPVAVATAEAKEAQDVWGR